MVTCYANLQYRDDHTPLFEQACDHWREIGTLSDAAVAELVKTDGIDILVDLNGHTRGHRLPVFAHKPAPLQASWLGYFNTTGLKTIDYLISDAVSTPADTQQRFAESIMRLPPPYGRFPYGHPTEAPAVTQRGGNDVLTFGCFNNISKIGSEVVSLWSQILRTLPQTRLVLKSKMLG